MARHDFYKASGAEKVFAVELQAEVAFTADATNYYEFVVRLKRDGQTYGEKVGETYSLAARSLVANEAVTLYDNAVGLAMSDGERLVLEVTETGSPTGLVGLTLWVDRSREAR